MLYVLAVLAVARLTRLVTADTLTDRPRRWLQDRLPPSIGYLIGCPWCASVYLSAPVSTAVVLWPTNRLVWAVLLGLSGSYAAGWLQSREQLDVVVHDAPPAGE